MIITPESYSPNRFYHLMTQTLIPRPIAWVLTENRDQGFNLAPFSYFTPISANPPLLVVSVGKKSKLEEKDTRFNLIHHKACVVHIASTDQSGDVNLSSESLAYNESEIDKLGIQLSQFEGFALPRISACKVAMGCSLFDNYTILGADQQLLILKIEQMYLSDIVTETDSQGRLVIDAKKIDPLARLGGNQYSGISQPFEKKGLAEARFFY